jgi:1-acyl-sn-glycerol-3-phosphate acyltransferase
MSGTQPEDGATSRWLYETVRLLARIAIPFVARLRTEGMENIPKDGPVILAMNHIHWLDIPMASVRVKRVTHYMAKIELFRVPILGGIMRRCGAFPVRRGEGDREALRTSERLLEQGEVVVIFPEGHRSDNGALISAHPGVGLIALRSQVPIVPVGISGTRSALKGGRFLFWAPRVTVRYGKPFTLGTADGRRTRESLAQATDTIMYRIAELLPPEQRGLYANPPAVEVAPADREAARTPEIAS